MSAPYPRWKNHWLEGVSTCYDGSGRVIARVVRGHRYWMPEIYGDSGIGRVREYGAEFISRADAQQWVLVQLRKQ